MLVKETIRELMKDRDMIISDLALRINATKVYTYKLATGKVRISKALSKLLGDAFNIDEIYLYNLQKTQDKENRLR